jgi:hypothetical protein
MSHLTMSQFATRLDFEQAQANQNGKQLVQYSELLNIRVGYSALVVPVDHPDTYNVSNTMVAHTSVVQWYNGESGVFETLNSRYVPEGGVRKQAFPVDPAC